MKSLQHVNNFAVINWWKLLQYFTYSWRKTAKIKQTLLDNYGAPKLIIFEIENPSTCLKKQNYKDIFGLKLMCYIISIQEEKKVLQNIKNSCWNGKLKS